MTPTPFPAILSLRGRRLPFPFIHLCRTGLMWLARCYGRYLQRIALADLDHRLLEDIGLTEKDVRRECEKPFWRS